MRLISVIALMIAMSSCGTFRAPPDVTWVEPIKFSQETKDWLGSVEGAPDSLWEDLWKVSKHNQKCHEILGKQ